MCVCVCVFCTVFVRMTGLHLILNAWLRISPHIQENVLCSVGYYPGLLFFVFFLISFNTIVLIFRTESTTMTKKFKVKQGSLACMSWNCWCICVLRTKSCKLRSSSVRVKTRTLLILELLLVLMGTVMLHSQRGSMNTNQCDRAQQKQAVCASPCVYPITITTYHVKKRHTAQ